MISRWGSGAFGAGVALVAMWACGTSSPPDGVDVDASPSPNASILPAPLASVPFAGPSASSSVRVASSAKPAGSSRPSAVASGKTTRPDDRRAPAGSAMAISSIAPAPMPTPDVVRVGDVLASDVLSARDTAGVVMLAEWKWVDPGGPPRAAEVNAEGISAAKKATAFRWNVLATELGRLKISLEGRSFPLSPGTELRARSDLAAHLLVSPDGNYRVALPGSLRALFSERRLDVLPLAAPDTVSRSTLGARFGAPVRRIELGSKVGRITMDLARIPEAGAGAGLFCRTLVELAAIDPTLAGCNREELPIRAHLAWPGGGGIVLDALEITRRAEMPSNEVQCPPQGAFVANDAMSPLSSVTLLMREEAAALRFRPVDVSNQPDAPSEGIKVRNEADLPRFLVVDGVPVAWVIAGGELHVPGLVRGKYLVQWRSFLGESGEPATLIEVPARLGWPATVASSVPSAKSSK